MTTTWRRGTTVAYLPQDPRASVSALAGRNEWLPTICAAVALTQVYIQSRLGIATGSSITPATRPIGCPIQMVSEHILTKAVPGKAHSELWKAP
eukprot:4332301-Amphidinium_carterae.1